MLCAKKNASQKVTYFSQFSNIPILVWHGWIINQIEKVRGTKERELVWSYSFFSCLFVCMPCSVRPLSISQRTSFLSFFFLRFIFFFWAAMWENQVSSSIGWSWWSQFSHTKYTKNKYTRMSSKKKSFFDSRSFLDDDGDGDDNPW